MDTIELNILKKSVNIEQELFAWLLDEIMRCLDDDIDESQELEDFSLWKIEILDKILAVRLDLEI